MNPRQAERDGDPEEIFEADSSSVVAGKHPVGSTFELRLLELLLGPPDLRSRRGNGWALRLRLTRELSRHADGTCRQSCLDFSGDLDWLNGRVRRQVLKRVEARRLRAASGLERRQAIVERRLLEVRAQDVRLYSLTNLVSLARRGHGIGKPRPSLSCNRDPAIELAQAEEGVGH